MFNDMLAMNSGDGGGVNTITGKAAKTRSFTAIIGHRYIVAFDSLSRNSEITNPVDGLDVIDSSGRLDTQEYNSVDAELQVVIGIATKTTVTCSWRAAASTQYSNIIWIDLDAQ